jgi:hypothetical protein
MHVVPEPLRRFELHRDTDETGVSGTGVVASGVLWPDGHCALRWLTEHRSTCFYTSIEDVKHIHGHGGKTRVVFIDTAGPHEWLCCQCGGGSINGHCFDCGASQSTILAPAWFAKAMSEGYRSRYASAYRNADYLREALTAPVLDADRYAALRGVLEKLSNLGKRP